MSTIYTVRIIHIEDIRSWAKIGLVFDALKTEHHNSLEDRKIFLGIAPDHGWIYEEEGEVLSETTGKTVVMKIDLPG